MIDATEALKNIRLPGPDEVEVQRIGGEIVARIRSKDFDGRPVAYEIPVGEGEEQQSRTYRIACALQRRFQSRLWTVFLENGTSASGLPVHRLWLAIDAAACRTVTTPRPQAPIANSPIDVSPSARPLPTSPVISIILGTCNRLALLKRAIASIRTAVGNHTYEIIVCDGGSTDGSREWLAAQPDVLLIGEHRLEGAVRAFNQAFALSRGAFVANFNDDAEYEGRALEEAVRYLRERPHCGQVAIAFRDKTQNDKKVVNAVFPPEMFPAVTWGTTYANFGAIRRTVIERVARIQGGFWNPIYRTYAGDCELSAWVWKLGYTVDKLETVSVIDALEPDALRERNSSDLTDDTRRMNARWPADAFDPDGPDPKVTREEIARLHKEQGDVVREMLDEREPLKPGEVDTALHEARDVLGFYEAKNVAETVGWPEPEEESRLRRIAAALRPLDPVEGKIPAHVERLHKERVLHVHLGTERDLQIGLVRALRELGSDGYEQIPWLNYNRDNLQDEIISRASTLRPTLVFMQLQAPDVVDVETIRALRRLADPSCVICTWNGDIASINSPHNVDWQVPLARVVDLHLHSSYSHVLALRAAGAHNAFWMDIGYDEEQYRPRPDALDTFHIGKNDSTIGPLDRQPYAVAFLGNHYGTDEFARSMRRHDAVLRDDVVAGMKCALGDRFGLYGAGWKQALAGHGIAHEDAIAPLDKAHEVYWRSKIGLSISLSNDLYCYSSDRLHRIIGSGLLLLVKRFPMMSVLGLEHDKNCLIFDMAEQAVALAREALSNLFRLDKIAAAGTVLAIERHTWSARMGELLALVEAARSAQ